jgi:hypothetical protein
VRVELSLAREILDMGISRFNLEKDMLDMEMVKLSMARDMLDMGMVELNVARDMLDMGMVKLNMARNMLDMGMVELNMAKDMFDMGMVELSLARDMLDMGWDRRRGFFAKRSPGTAGVPPAFLPFSSGEVGVRVPCENTVHGRTLGCVPLLRPDRPPARPGNPE